MRNSSSLMFSKVSAIEVAWLDLSSYISMMGGRSTPVLKGVEITIATYLQKELSSLGNLRPFDISITRRLVSLASLFVSILVEEIEDAAG